MKSGCRQVAVLCLALNMTPSLVVGAAYGASTDNCRLAPEHGDVAFPVDQLPAESRCLLVEVVDHPDASGTIGPRETPIGIDLYAYLLDHPTVTAILMQRMGMGSFQIMAKGSNPNRYWVNDGDGAEGLLSIVFHDAHSRIYYIDGQHRSTLFPTIRAKTVVFMRIMPGTTLERHAVQTVLTFYTRFEDGMLSRLMRLFRPLVTRAVNHTLTKEFSLTHRLGLLIAEQPRRILQEAEALSGSSFDDRPSLLALLQAETFLFHPPDRSP